MVPCRNHWNISPDWLEPTSGLGGSRQRNIQFAVIRYPITSPWNYTSLNQMCRFFALPDKYDSFLRLS